MTWSSDCIVHRHENDNRCFPADFFFSSVLFLLFINHQLKASSTWVQIRGFQRGSEVLQYHRFKKKIHARRASVSEYLKGAEKKINKNQFTKAC